MEKSGIGNDKA